MREEQSELEEEEGKEGATVRIQQIVPRFHRIQIQTITDAQGGWTHVTHTVYLKSYLLLVKLSGYGLVLCLC